MVQLIDGLLRIVTKNCKARKLSAPALMPTISAGVRVDLREDRQRAQEFIAVTFAVVEQCQHGQHHWRDRLVLFIGELSVHGCQPIHRIAIHLHGEGAGDAALYLKIDLAVGVAAPDDHGRAAGAGSVQCA